jgi:hypothetical protein
VTGPVPHRRLYCEIADANDNTVWVERTGTVIVLSTGLPSETDGIASLTIVEATTLAAALEAAAQDATAWNLAQP